MLRAAARLAAPAVAIGAALELAAADVLSTNHSFVGAVPQLPLGLLPDLRARAPSARGAGAASRPASWEATATKSRSISSAVLCARRAVVGSGIRAMDGRGPAAKAHFQAVASARHVVQGRRPWQGSCSWFRVGPMAHNCRSFASRGWSSGQVILPGHFSRNSTGPVIWAKWPVTGILHRSLGKTQLPSGWRTAAPQVNSKKMTAARTRRSF